MGDFFKGWRRKIGCVTLVMALVFVLGWIRSLQTSDKVVVALGMMSLEAQSENGILELMLHRISGRKHGYFGIEETHWISEELPPVVFDEYGYSNLIEDTYLDWRHEKKATFCGLMFASGNETTGKPPFGSRVETNVIAFPYGFATIPMTLLSALLLLSKPRKSTQKKITAPVPAEGA